MSGDAKTMIESAVKSFLEEVPALAPMKLVVQVDFHARGDTQQFRIEMPDLAVTKGMAPDAKVRMEMRREFFNAMVENGARVADWREAFTYGQAKATGVEQYLRLIEQVVEKAEERQRTRRALAPVTEPRYRLTVHDHLNVSLVGRRSISYTSPPQPYDEALVLAGILLDRPEGLTGAGPWFRPIAGGQRTVQLEAVADIAASQLHLDVAEPS